jgi:hypothetical protein
MVIDRDPRIGSGLPKTESEIQRVKMARAAIQTTAVIYRSRQVIFYFRPVE